MKNRIPINKILAVAVVVCVLTAAWFYGGNNHSNETAESFLKPESMVKSGEAGSSSLKAHGQTNEKDLAAKADSGNLAETEAAKTANKHETNQGEYLTDPVPTDKPEPVEPQAVQVTDKKCTCTLSITCNTILHNMKDFNQDKREVLPADGIIFSAREVTFFEGESVFNVLQREMKKAGIQLEFQATPLYNSKYIEGIDNIYEFDCGELSGWMYRVNDWFPNYGCSRYKLSDGDNIEWVYTCNLGRDLGGDYKANRGGE